ncbi:MAG: cupin domain-containing protein [Sphingomonadaceae bacterium]
MPKITLTDIPQSNATGYPPHYADVVEERWYRRLGPATGLSDFAVSQVVLKPGAWSAQRHWHEDEDEFVVILSGEAVLVDDDGRHPMVSGDCASFPKGDSNGHCLINESAADCVFIVVGKTTNGDCHYPDVDMHNHADSRKTRKNGAAF